MKDQKIAEIGPNVAIPAGAQVIDLSNEWLMPGVMDTHTHVTFLEHDLRKHSRKPTTSSKKAKEFASSTAEERRKYF